MRLLLFVLLAKCVIMQQQTSGQHESTSSVDASSMMSISGTSYDQFQQSLQSQAEEAFAALTSDPESLNSVMSQFLTWFTQAIVELIVSYQGISEQSTASQQATTIAEAVFAALSVAAESTDGGLESLNVAGISDGIENAVEEILTSAEFDGINLVNLTQQVGTIVGNAVVSALVGNTNQQISVSPTTLQTPANLGSQNLGATQNDLLLLIAAEDFQGLVQVLSIALNAGDTDEVTEALVAGVSESISTINSSLTLAFLDESFPAWPLATSLGAAYREDAIGIALVLSQAITAANFQQNAPGLADALSFSFVAGGEALSAMDTALSQSVIDNGCVSVANVLAQAQQLSDSQGVGVNFQQAVLNNAQIAECLRVGVQLQISIGLLQLLNNPQEAATEISRNLQQGNIEAISNLITTAVSVGRTEDLISSLSLLFNKPYVNPTDAAFALTVAVQSGGPQVQYTVANALRQASLDENTNLLVPMLQYALQSAPQNVTDVFVAAIGTIVEQEGNCDSLQHVVSLVIEEDTSQEQKDAILLVIFDQPRLLSCVDESLLWIDQQNFPSQDSPRLSQIQPGATVLPKSVQSQQTTSTSIVMGSVHTPEPAVLQIQDVPSPQPELSLSNDTEESFQDISRSSLASATTPTLTPIPAPTALPMPTPSPTLTPIPTTTNIVAPYQDLQDKEVFRYDKHGQRVLIGSCFDITPPGEYSCEQQAAFGKCSRRWMLQGSFCSVTCGFCQDRCIEIQPTDLKTCEIQRREGKCRDLVQSGFCYRTCGECSSDNFDLPFTSPTTQSELTASTSLQANISNNLEEKIDGSCDDTAPDSLYTCAQQAEFQKCDTQWMIAGNFCRKTCGRCSDTNNPTQIEEVSVVENISASICSCCDQQSLENIGQAVAQAVAKVLRELNLAA